MIHLSPGSDYIAVVIVRPNPIDADIYPSSLKLVDFIVD